MKFSLRLLYLYLFAFVGLMIVVFGSIQLVNLGIKTFVFPEADNYWRYDYPQQMDEKGELVPVDEGKIELQQKEEQKRQRQRELANSVAMLVVGTPLYLYHWKTIQREAKAAKRQG